MAKVSKELLDRGWKARHWRNQIGLLGGLMAGFFLTVYTFWGGRHIYMEQPLSFNHAGLEQNCGNCHHAFKGVNDTQCAFPCHSGGTPESNAMIPFTEGIHYIKGRFGHDDCLECHPAECHSVPKGKKGKGPVGQERGGIPCEPQEVENLVLPDPLTVETCNSCHPAGCERSVRCFDCHVEHLDGMPLPVNRSDEVFPGKFAFSKKLLRLMESDHRAESVKVRRILPLGKLVKSDGTISYSVESLRSKMPAGNCLACHPGILNRVPPKPEHWGKSLVPKSIFRHNSPGHRKYRRCRSCHRSGWLVERDPEENIFTMEACGKRCHYIDDCTECHKFHHKAAKPGEHVDLPARLQYMLEATKTATPENR